MQVKVRAPSNIAIIKYWGKSDSNVNWPSNSSLSMTLKNCYTETQVSLADQSSFTLNDQRIDLQDPKHRKIQKQLELLQQSFGIQDPLSIQSKNSFPTGAGIASSASGMAALTLALHAFQFPTEAELLTKTGAWQNPELVELARRGSGSACRSLAGGFVEWQKGASPANQIVKPITDESFWSLFDTIIIVNKQEKAVHSTKGHLEAATSPLFRIRQSAIAERLKRLELAIEHKDIWTLGWILEEEAYEMHAVMLSQRQALQYFSEQSIFWIQKIRQFRQDTNTPVFWTLDAGVNLHIIGNLADQQATRTYLQSCDASVTLLMDETGSGPTLQIDR